MLDENQEQVGGALQSYSREEFAALCQNWQWEAIFRGIIAQNAMLYNETEHFADFIAGNAQRPQTPLSSLLRPASNPSANYSESLLRQLYDLMTKTSPEEVICPETGNIASRSTFTLLDALEQISPTRYLVDARAAIERIFILLLSKTRPTISMGAYHRELKELFETFIKSCAQNARELTFQEQELWHCSMKHLKIKPKKTPRPSLFNDIQRETVKRVWQEAQHNDFLLGNCSKTRLTHAMAFNHFKSELRVTGINTLEDFNRCLESERNRNNYRYNMGKLFKDK